ncbi:MAG TPA: response regulator transcription factor, partial [Solirubrobacteraceae bacterium]|nr:response regulator transcription factor [Solirubrobacteraceae bacterium]
NRVMGVYATPRELRQDLSTDSSEAQIAIIDADDPACGIAVLAEVRRAHPKLKILLLCEPPLAPPVLRGAIDEDVEGLVLKSDSVEEVMLAFQHVLEGRSVMPSGWQDVSLEPASATPLDSLSMREREVLELAAAGMRNREIAERLMISANTVKFHLRVIYSRLGVHNRIQAARATQPESDGGAEPGDAGGKPTRKRPMRDSPDGRARQGNFKQRHRQEDRLEETNTSEAER